MLAHWIVSATSASVSTPHEGMISRPKAGRPEDAPEKIHRILLQRHHEHSRTMESSSKSHQFPTLVGKQKLQTWRCRLILALPDKLSKSSNKVSKTASEEAYQHQLTHVTTQALHCFSCIILIHSVCWAHPCKQHKLKQLVASRKKDYWSLLCLPEFS